MLEQLKNKTKEYMLQIESREYVFPWGKIDNASYAVEEIWAVIQPMQNLH